MRRVLLVLVLLVGALAVIDRVAALGAERVVSERIQHDQALAVRPDVSIGGFPFLTQAADGEYDDVTVTLSGVRRGDLVIDEIRAHLTGVHVPAEDVVRQEVDHIRIEHATAEIELTYGDLNAALDNDHIRIGPGSEGKVHVTASGSVGGATISISGDVPVTVSGEDLVIDAGQGVVAHVPLPDLPFGIELESARAGPDGVVIVCSAEGLVITR